VPASAEDRAPDHSRTGAVPENLWRPRPEYERLFDEASFGKLFGMRREA